MTEFKIQNAKEEDLLTYSDFFAQSPLFNTLNSPAQPKSVDHNFISRMAVRSVEKLIFYHHQPVFYLAYRKSTFIQSIETMIYDERIPLNQAALIEFIQIECFHQTGLKQLVGKFDYYMPQNASFYTNHSFF